MFHTYHWLNVSQEIALLNSKLRRFHCSDSFKIEFRILSRCGEIETHWHIDIHMKIGVICINIAFSLQIHSTVKPYNFFSNLFNPFRLKFRFWIPQLGFLSQKRLSMKLVKTSYMILNSTNSFVWTLFFFVWCVTHFHPRPCTNTHKMDELKKKTYSLSI